MRLNWAKRLTVPVFLAAAIGLAGGVSGQDKKEPELTTKWVYKEATSKENITNKDGKMFQPFDLLPKERAENDDVTVSHEVPFDKADEKKGTICELSFRLATDQWAAVRFTPDGAPAGRNRGYNVKEALFLDGTKPIYLVVRAKSTDKVAPTVTFKIGGVTGAFRDGTEEHPWKFAKSLRTKLTDEWKEYAIDLQGLHNELEHVACALTVNVAGAENGGRPVTLLIDELRFSTVKR